MRFPFLWLFVSSFLLLSCQATTAVEPTLESETTALSQTELIALGDTVYAEHCAECHGANLEGEPNWREPNPDGTFRAPPHDETGHTWHHDDGYLWERIQYGTAVLPPESRDKSDMPAYQGELTPQEILAVLAYIKDSWPPDIQEAQRQRTEMNNNSN